jgi:predicted ATPase
LRHALPAEPTLIGRDEEIKTLLHYFNSALDGKGTTVFVCGEAGVGKTRLVNEFLKHAKKAGAKILSGWCLSEAAIPYFPFTEAFNAYISTASDEKAKSTMKKQLGMTGWLKGPESSREAKAHEMLSTPEIERDRTFEAVARVLLQSSEKEPLVLFLDDLQWADHLSLALLHYLARKCKASKLLIIGTYRSEELIRTKEEKLHPLEQTMFSMSREDLLIKMELNRLKRNDFPELLTSMFHSLTDENFVEKIYKETEGNPLFALETLNLLVEEGFLSERDDRWALAAPFEKVGIPTKVHEVIAQRIARLGREERKLLDLAAISGYSFNPDILSRTSELDITDVLQTLNEIEKRHRLVRSEDSAFTFTHQKIREVICEDLPGELRKVYHLKTASCLKQVLAEKISDGYLADIAFHYVEGGAPEKAFEYLIKLGEKAVNICANAQAIEYLSEALEAARKTADLATKENLAKIYKLRGRAWLGQDEKTKARNDFNLMLQHAANIGDESMVAEAHHLLGASYEAYFGEMDDAMRHLNTAVEMARKTGNKRLEAKSLGTIGSTFMWGTNPDTMDEGRKRLEESSRIAKEIGDKIIEASNLGTLGMYYNWRGEFNQAKEKLNRVLALDEEVRSTPGMAFDLLCLCMVLAGNGEYNDAISAAHKCLQLARGSGLVSYICMVLNTLGWIYHDLSNIELAIKYNNEALEVAKAHQKSRASGAVPMSLLNLGMDYLCKNDYESAEKYFKEVINVYEQHRVGWWRIESRILLGRGEIALAEGDYAKALKLAQDSLAISEKTNAKKYIARGLNLKAETLAKMGNIEEAFGLMQNASKLAQEVGNPPLLWQVHYSLGLLHEKHENPLEANAHFSEAIALIEATASKLNDKSLADTLLTAQKTMEIREAFTKTKPTR